MKIKFEGTCPHCQQPIELIRVLPPELIEAICKTPQQVLHPDKTEEGAERPETKIPTTVQELMTWVASHGKKYNATWACQQLNVSASAEIKDVQAAYTTIKALADW